LAESGGYFLTNDNDLLSVLSAGSGHKGIPNCCAQSADKTSRAQQRPQRQRGTNCAPLIVTETLGYTGSAG